MTPPPTRRFRSLLLVAAAAALVLMAAGDRTYLVAEAFSLSSSAPQRRCVYRSFGRGPQKSSTLATTEPSLPSRKLTFCSAGLARTSPLSSSSSESTSEGSSDEGGEEILRRTDDELLVKTSNALRRTSWLSWWTQVILTTVSSVILLFARNIGLAAAAQGGGAGQRFGQGGFFFAGSGVTLSVMSILWTWGGARLSRRLLNTNTTRINAANLTRRAIKVASSLNMTGMAVTILGAFVIIGELATKVLTTQGITPFGAGMGAAAVAGQTIQPLDILIVQANCNTLLSHYASLFYMLFLTRFVDRLDPPSTEDDPRD